MYKHNVKIGAILALAMLSAFFFACKTSDTSVTKYKVTIDLNGGTGLGQTEYTVNDGDTLSITGTPTKTPTYYVFKDYYDTTNNSVFVPGTTPVKGDIALKVEWDVDLKVVRDILTKGSWKGPLYTFTFNTISADLLDLNYDYTTTIGSSKLNQSTTIMASDDPKYIAKLFPILIPNKSYYIESLDGPSSTWYDSTTKSIETYTKQP